MEKPANVLLVYRSIIIDKKNRLLVVRRSLEDRHNAGLWEFPGGKVDVGENISTSLAREVYEETGLVTEPISSLTFAHSEILASSREDRLYVALFHVARLSEGHVRMSEEHAAFQWDTLEMARQRKLTFESRKALEVFADAKLI
jgi:8-oxo-dGTP diphosphatase